MGISNQLPASLVVKGQFNVESIKWNI